MTRRVTEALPVGAAGRKSCIFLEIPWWNASAEVFELGAVSREKAAVGVLVVGGAFEAKHGGNPGAGGETRSEPRSAAQPGPDGFGCGGDHHKLSSEFELRNSRALLV